MEFRCPHCKRVYTICDEFSGGHVKCTGCGARLVLRPGPEAVFSPGEAKETAPKPVQVGPPRPAPPAPAPGGPQPPPLPAEPSPPTPATPVDRPANVAPPTERPGRFARLNTAQRVAVYVGIATICGMVAFPPWQVMRDNGRERWRMPSKYSWVFSPPEVVKLSGGLSYCQTATIDLGRLVAQCALVAVGTGLAVLVLRRRPHT